MSALHRWRRRVLGRIDEEMGSAVVEFIVLAVLLLTPLFYLVLMLGRVQAGSYAVTQAAREAGRAFVTAPDDGVSAARADAAARIAFEDQGFGGEGQLTVSCSASPCLTPEGEISSVATVSVPLPLIPAVARDVIPLEVPVSATQVSVVPRYEAQP